MTSTELTESRRRAEKALRGMRKAVSYKTALSNIRDRTEDPFRILVSTILSTRTRDPVTERVSNMLFKEYPDAVSLSKSRYAAVAKIIRPVNFYKGKTRKIIAASKEIVTKFNGVVPNTYNQLLELPGVGRKTAGCVLVYGFNLPAIPVDVHVHRISNRIGLVSTKNPEYTEKKLLELYGKKDWIAVNEQFVTFGQTVCLPRNPRCSACPLSQICDYYQGTALRVKRKTPCSKAPR